jgi:thymidylate synthase (FAD)
LEKRHESVIEHEEVLVWIICDRGVSHEIVRHRIASYSQESTRYCKYTKNKFGKELTLIRPFFWNEEPNKFSIWKETMQKIKNNYNLLISLGARSEEARSILLNSSKTEIIVTMNLREWRRFSLLRASSKARLQMHEIAVLMFGKFKELISIVLTIYKYLCFNTIIGVDG